jgi:hypothetical protein
MLKTLQEQVQELTALGVSPDEAAKMVMKEQENQSQVLKGGSQSNRQTSRTKVLKQLTILSLGSVEEMEALAKKIGFSTLNTKDFETFIAKNGQNAGRFGVSSGSSFRGPGKFMAYLSDQQGETHMNLLLESRDRIKTEVKALKAALEVAEEMDGFTTAIIQHLFTQKDGEAEGVNESLRSKDGKGDSRKATA